MTTRTRRTLASAAALAALSALALTGCTYATDRENQVGAGGNNLHADVRVLSSVIVAPEDGSGTYVVTLALDPTVAANTSEDNPSLTEVGLAADDASGSTVETGAFTPIEIGDLGYVNLADPEVGGVPVTGDFKAGDMVKLQLTFSDGATVEVQTPVVPQCHMYADVAPQGGSAPAPSGKGAYACEYLDPVPLHGESA